ncbi:hypothetical protein [Amycolatopsis sp. Hca4]|uniref:hypothetical protein n=1 Tax=Amycolatopsis sp. Hca4 TaxID=2742131 RepID=UPI001590CC9B|nr:hypothetical protein [Amycolatopsis sp. Hca4]QKV80251.1 hypothetical protein HUT10_45505 [Amycolatopsis sp. Hca4]
MSECQCLCAPAGHQPQLCTGTAEFGKTVRLPGSPATALVPACAPCHQAAGAKPGFPGRTVGNPPPRRLGERDRDAAALARPGRRSARWPRANGSE